MFPGLEFLVSELAIGKGDYRVDTVAFDKDRNTFVVIEYKNRSSDSVVNQAKVYLKDMGGHRADLVLEYNKNHDPRDKNTFRWKSMYAIIVTPEFGRYLIEGNADNESLELHKVRLYGDDVIALQRVGGGHNPPNRDCKPLPELRYEKGMEPPKELICPNAKTFELKAWAGILVSTATWLNENGHLNKLNILMHLGPKNYLLSQTPVNPNGKPFPAKAKIGMFYLNTNANPEEIIKRSIRLIEEAGKDPSDFKACFGNPGHTT